MSDPKIRSLSPRYETLDGMRGIAALCVMIFHFMEYRQEKILTNAPLAVDFFFMLSGFVIAHSYGQRLQTGMSFLEYMGKRLVRLYPMFIAGVLLGVPVFYWLRQSGVAPCPPSFIATSLLYNLFYLPVFNDFGVYHLGSATPSVGAIFPTDPPAWSLFFEVVASGAFLFLFRLKRLGLVTTIVASYVLLLGISLWNAHYRHKNFLSFGMGWSTVHFFGGFPRVLFGFSLGMLIYSLESGPELAGIRGVVTRYVKSPSLVYLLLIIVFLFPVGIRGLYPAFVLAVAAPLLVFVGSVVTCGSATSLKLAKFLGWISYPLYCLHFPIGRAMFCLSAHGYFSKNIAILASIGATFLACFVLTKFYEEPTRAFLSRKLAQIPSSSHQARPTSRS